MVYFGNDEVRNEKLKGLVDAGRLVAFRATDASGTGLEDEVAEKDENSFRSSVFEDNLYNLMSAVGAKNKEYRLFDWTGNELAKSTSPATIASKVEEAPKLREKMEKKAEAMLEKAQKAFDAGKIEVAEKELVKLAKTGIVGFAAIEKAKDLRSSVNERLSEVASK